MHYSNICSEEQGENFFKKGLEAYRNKNYYEALNCFNNAINSNYRKKEYSMYKGFCYFELEQYSKTINYFKKLVREHFDVLMFFYIGFSQYNLGKFDDALTNIQFALKRTDDNIPSIIIDKAKECERNIFNGLTPSVNNDSNVIENPISINGKPNLITGLYEGIELYNNDKIEEALDIFNELLKNNEKDYNLWLYKGQALMRLNKKEESLKCFEESLKIKENPKALKYKKLLLSFRENSNPKKYNSLDSNNEKIDISSKISINDDVQFSELFYEGIELYEYRRYDDALKIFNELLKTNENNYELWLYKGKVFARLNEDEEALKCFERSINLHENYEALMYKSLILSFCKDSSAKIYIDKAMKIFNIEEKSLKEYNKLLNNKALVYRRLDSNVNKKNHIYTSLNSNQKYKRDPIPGALRHEVFKRDGYRCVECGATNKETTLHVDHILPVSQGGTNEISNLQTLCQKCNLAKSNRHWKGPQRY